MYIESLQREIAVCPHAEVEGFLAREPGRWHVISIREPAHPEASLKDALRSRIFVFLDVQVGTEAESPSRAHLESILRFAKQCRNAPLLVHCWAGRSRSTAVALVIILQSLWDQGVDGVELVRKALDALLLIRPLAAPNRLVLRLGLEQFLPPALASTLTKAVLSEPRLQKNFQFLQS
ncbi:hypothetical protein [Prosthecobacter sp.]|uniref:hypothetical protein n=1 Tax=Prosthecobacter sp. TaxID=1965333 RepID=UPI0037851FB6